MSRENNYIQPTPEQKPRKIGGLSYRTGVKVPSRNALARRSSNDQYSDYSYSSTNSQLGNY